MKTKNYKTTKLQTKIKTLITMILLIFASSCKKDKIEELRPTTFADFEKIMETDLNIKLLTTTTKSLFLKVNSNQAIIIKPAIVKKTVAVG